MTLILGHFVHDKIAYSSVIFSLGLLWKCTQSKKVVQCLYTPILVGKFFCQSFGRKSFKCF